MQSGGGFIQEVIHQLEVGAGKSVLRVILVFLAVVALIVVYEFRDYRNFSTAEAMDQAQLARNIADGKGYTTLFIRPFSLYLVQAHNEAEHTDSPAPAGTDFAKIQTGHPDLANPPVYPVILAGLMKILPFNFKTESTKPFWSEGGRFQRYEPDFLIGVFNQVLLLVVAILTFALARRVFDAMAAWLSAVLVLGCALLWRFSVSGLSTLLLIVIFLALAWCIMKIEVIAREAKPGGGLLAWVAAAGVLTGIGALTRYSFCGVIIPVVLFLVFFSGPRRVVHALVAVGLFLAVLAPWLVRNWMACGKLFGTAGYAFAEGATFPGTLLERSPHPDLNYVFFSIMPFVHKGINNLRGILENDLPGLGGSWVTILFLAGLLLSFRSEAARRLRYFLVMCLGTFIVFQALGPTQRAGEPSDASGGNLLVITAPLVFIYGVAFFVVLLDQMNFPVPQLRYAVVALVAVLCCLPLVFTLITTKVSPVVFPPYYPPDIQTVAGAMGKDDLMMSDIPWAVAWYGHRQCVWLTPNTQDDFNAMSDNYMKPVQGIYLSAETLDSKFFSEMARSPEGSWGRFLLQAGAQNQLPANFPLRVPQLLPSGMFLTDRPRLAPPH